MYMMREGVRCGVRNGLFVGQVQGCQARPAAARSSVGNAPRPGLATRDKIVKSGGQSRAYIHLFGEWRGEHLQQANRDLNYCCAQRLEFDRPASVIPYARPALELVVNSTSRRASASPARTRAFALLHATVACLPASLSCLRGGFAWNATPEPGQPMLHPGGPVRGLPRPGKQQQQQQR